VPEHRKADGSYHRLWISLTKSRYLRNSSHSIRSTHTRPVTFSPLGEINPRSTPRQDIAKPWRILCTARSIPGSSSEATSGPVKTPKACTSAMRTLPRTSFSGFANAKKLASCRNARRVNRSILIELSRRTSNKKSIVPPFSQTNCPSNPSQDEYQPDKPRRRACGPEANPRLASSWPPPMRDP